jgi:hypothetical protein
MISEHNHELFSNMSLYSQFKPATQGVLLFLCVSIPTLRFFTGSRKGTPVSLTPKTPAKPVSSKKTPKSKKTLQLESHF